MQGAANGEAQPGYFQAIDGLLQDQEVLQIIIDIHGASFSEGELKDEAAIIIDQPDGQWTVASVVNHGLENGKEGPQPVYIPLGDFIAINSEGETRAVLDLSQPYGPVHARFWNQSDFTSRSPVSWLAPIRESSGVGYWCIVRAPPQPSPNPTME